MVKAPLSAKKDDGKHMVQF